jgi:hypothetical protein
MWIWGEIVTRYFPRSFQEWFPSTAAMPTEYSESFTQENAAEVTSGGQSGGPSGANGNMLLSTCYLFRPLVSFKSRKACNNPA